MADITPIASLNGELAMPEKVWMQGPPGAAATVTVGTVTTGEPGTDAIVTNSGTENAAVLNFTIPRGETGATGPAGADGVSPTVSTSKSGNVTTITIVDAAGTKTATINDGAKGDTGPAGPAGAGVPDGGTVGQLLSKTESGTAWIDPPQSGGGGSVPKPLTYDYMPEGYPKKSVQTTTLLMEEQQVAFALNEKYSLYMAQLTNAFDVVKGQKYTVNWDGTEYECVGIVTNTESALGNTSVAGEGSDTGEPFIYVYNTKQHSGMFATHDTAASHTISVTTAAEVITPMAEEFLPTGIKELIMNSSTANSTKRFRITVDDSGTISATEVT